MTKSLIADKVKDGWLVRIKTSYCVGCETDVRKIIRYEGLKERKQFSHKPTTENKNEWIYAD